MTTAKPKTRTYFRLPDPPKHPDDKMTSSKHLSATGNHHHLAMHLGNPDTTIVSGELYVVIRPTRNMAGSHYPDLLVAFDADPALYDANNGYVISEQGKPPDFVLEIASRHTGHIDIDEKREAYAELRIPEYWRFDETGRYHRTRLAGDRLVGRPVPAHRHRRVGVGRVAGVQRCSEPASALDQRDAGLARPGYGPAHRHLHHRAVAC